MILPLTEKHKAANLLKIKYACEIFADRNYDEKGLLIDRKEKNALVKNINTAINNIKYMIEKSAIRSITGKFLKTDIDTICIHGDGKNSVSIAKKIKKGLIDSGINLLPLNQLSKFK